MSNRKSNMCDWKLRAWGAAILALVVGVLLVESVTAGEDKTEPTPFSPVPAPSAGPQEGVSGPTPSSAVPPPVGEPEEGRPGPAPSSASPAPQGGPQEGVKVHGRWTIEVRDPDGTLVSRREFENLLRDTGAQTLARTLGRKISVGLWRVSIQGPCPGSCTIAETATSPSPLMVDVPTSGDNANKLVLVGTTNANLTAAATAVLTTYLQCPNTTPPSAPCTTGAFSTFTSFTLPPPGVSVQEGQQIKVTVVFTFS